MFFVKPYTTIPPVFLLLFILSTTGFCQDNAIAKAIREDSLIFSVDDETTALKIDSYNGRIKIIKGADKSTIHGTAVTFAYGDTKKQAQIQLSKIAWEFSKHGNTLNLSLKGLLRGGSDLNELQVPADWNLKLQNSNGNISIAEGFHNIQVETSNGKITIEGGERIFAETANGKISYTGTAKQFILLSANGQINMRLNGNWNGQAKAESSNGKISLQCTGLINASLESFTGHGKTIIYGPKLLRTSDSGSLLFSTANGNIIIRHPISARVF